MSTRGDAGGKTKKMREIPVLFNGAMVRAIFDDRKTQTRRIVKRQPPGVYSVVKWTQAGDLWYPSPSGSISGLPAERSPLGKPGDRLWVRETTKRFTGVPVGGKPWPTEAPWVLSPDGDPYKALLHVVGNEEHVKALEYHVSCVTCVSIHMPRWAARLFTDVLDVRIERLQDISEEDARAEGVDEFPVRIQDQNGRIKTAIYHRLAESCRDAFQRLWISVYGAESWAANPWVWVTEFKRVT